MQIAYELWGCERRKYTRPKKLERMQIVPPAALGPSYAPAVTLCQMVSGSVSIGGLEEGKFEGDSPTEEVAAQIRLRGADPV
jgi:hypothetical protein